MGVDPAKYPLAGNLTIAEPKNTALAQLLANAGDVIITKDLASSEKLSVGDTLQLSDLDYGISINAVIRGIASDTPNHQGSKVYFSHQTAQELMNLRAREIGGRLQISSTPDAGTTVEVIAPTRFVKGGK